MTRHDVPGKIGRLRLDSYRDSNRAHESFLLGRADDPGGVEVQDQPGISCPAAVDIGNLPRVSQTCAHPTSRAARSGVNASVSRPARTHHAVGSDATGPNNPG